MYISRDQPIAIKQHEIFADQSLKRALRDQISSFGSSNWEPFFNATYFALKNKLESLEQWALSKQQRNDYGKQVTKLRKFIRDRALAMLRKDFTGNKSEQQLVETYKLSHWG